MMTAREKAIEAAGLTKDDIATGIAGLWENAWMDPDCRPGPDDVANAVVELIRADIAPHIESALLDRLLSEDAVQAAAKAWFIAESGTEGMWNRLGPKAKNRHYRLARAALTAAVAAALSDIREEASAQSGEGK